MKRFYFTILCVVLSLSGCVTPDNGVDEVPTNGRTTLTATTSQLKITTAEALLESETTHTWNTLTHIGVFGKEGGENAKYSLFNSYDGAAEGLFYGAEVKGDIYAYYPYDKDVTAEGSKISLTLPDTQNYNADLVAQFEQHNNLYVAKSTDGIVDFGYLYGSLAIQVKGNFTVRSITLSSSSQPLAGRIAFDFENDMEASAVARSLYSLTVACGEGVVATDEAPALIHALLPSATYTDLAITVKTDKGEISKKLNGAYTVKRVTSLQCTEAMSSGTIVADFESLTLGELVEATPRTWAKGATIGVFSEDSKNTLYAIESSSVGKAEAQFVGATASGDIVAYYPYNAQASLSEGKLTISTDSKQTYNPSLLSQFVENTPLMVAKATTGEKLSFEYVMGVLAVNVKANLKIRHIEVSSSKPLAGRLVFDTANDYLCSEAESGAKQIITLDASAELPEASLDAPKMFYISLPAGEYDDLAVTVTADNGETLTATVAEKVIIKRMNLATIAEDITYQTIDIVLEDVEYGKVAWSEGDQLSIYNEARGKGIVSTILGAAGSKRNRVVAVGTPNEPFNVAYPASAVKSLDTKATITFPESQLYTEEAVAKESQIYVGRSREGVAQLNLLTSILAIEVVANYDCQIWGIDITSKSKPLAGVADVDMSYEKEPTVLFTSAKNNIRLVMESPVAISNGASKVFYVAIPAATYDAEELSIAVDGTLGATIKSVTTALTTERAVCSETAISTIKCTNLTEGGKYANCFIMPNKKGWYMFDAKIKGGYDNDDDGTAVISKNAIAGTLFELNKGMISNVHTCNNSQSVSFYYDGSEGNASIVTIEGGMVLWAWHLWCPGAGQPKDVVLGSNTYFDRNLGALKVPTSKAEMEAMTDADFLASGGMLYQWGRPSPFPYAKNYTNEAWANRLSQSGENTPTYYYPSADLITVGGAGGAGGAIPVSVMKRFTSSITQAFWETNASATKSPLFIGCQTNNTTQRHWNKIWSMDPSHAEASWNYSDEKHKQYDPCPYGYELPLTATIVADLQAVNEATPPTAHLAAEGNCKGGYYIEREGEFLWHAVSGLRQYYGLWTTVNSPNANFAGATTNDSKQLFLYWGKGAGARNVNTGSWAPVTAMGVRCIKK